jgi:hypothetical protein
MDARDRPRCIRPSLAAVEGGASNRVTGCSSQRVQQRQKFRKRARTNFNNLLSASLAVCGALVTSTATIAVAPPAVNTLPPSSPTSPRITINTTAPIHVVDGGFVSFALDQPWLVNFSEASGGRMVNFSDPVLRAVVALVSLSAAPSLHLHSLPSSEHVRRLASI